MRKRISGRRKGFYQVGNILQIVGFLLFASTFVTFFINFGNFDGFEHRARSMGLRAFGGIALLIAGGALRNVAARGLAGSGVVLDPGQARDDLEPYSRMAGGMVKDALEEVLDDASQSERVVMLKCSSCATLNEEDSKYCQECGRRF